MGAYSEGKVLSVHHWTDKLFTFTCTRDPSFRFISGQFTMIGLMVDGKPLMRAYSMVSAHYEETLEFLSIKVPDGPLTSRLMHVAVGDTVLIGRKPVGTLLVDNLRPGRNCYLFSTGTGIAPFMSIIKDPEAYNHFEKIILIHTVREAAELAYHDFIAKELPENEFFGDLVKQKLVYYDCVTREPYPRQGRVTDLVRSGKLYTDLGVPPLDPAHDRAMICGNPNMLVDIKAMLEEKGFTEGANNRPAEFVIEKAFVEK